jgi:hypothetical protein
MIYFDEIHQCTEKIEIDNAPELLFQTFSFFCCSFVEMDKKRCESALILVPNCNLHSVVLLSLNINSSCYNIFMGFGIYVDFLLSKLLLIKRKISNTVNTSKICMD